MSPRVRSPDHIASTARSRRSASTAVLSVPAPGRSGQPERLSDGGSIESARLDGRIAARCPAPPLPGRCGPIARAGVGSPPKARPGPGCGTCGGDVPSARVEGRATDQLPHARAMVRIPASPRRRIRSAIPSMPQFRGPRRSRGPQRLAGAPARTFRAAPRPRTRQRPRDGTTTNRDDRRHRTAPESSVDGADGRAALLDRRGDGALAGSRFIASSPSPVTAASRPPVPGVRP
jgi:hypothetical protein